MGIPHELLGEICIQPGAMSSTGISQRRTSTNTATDDNPAAWGSNTWLFRAAYPLKPFNAQHLLNPTLSMSTSVTGILCTAFNMAKFTPFHCKMNIPVFYCYIQLLT